MSNSTSIKISDSLNGYAVQPAGKGSFPGMVVLMEAFGITAHIQSVCERLANAGFAAVAPDIFHGDVFAYTDTDKVRPKIQTIRDDQVMGEMAESLDWLETQHNVNRERLGIIGFCMGGRLAFLAHCRFPDRLQAAVSFYGGGIAPDGPDRFGRIPPIGEAEKTRVPVFLGYGAEDSSITPTEHARVAEKLSSLKKRYTLAVYPGAGHGFLCEERASYAPAMADIAWKEAIGFLQSTLA